MPPVWTSLPLSHAQLSLAHVLKSGQSFRWTLSHLPKTDCPPPIASAEYSLCLSDRLVLLRQSPTHLHYATLVPPGRPDPAPGSTLAWLMDYFQLEMDLVKLYATWGETDRVFAGEEQRAGVLSGVRVLRQDPWECLFGFICSSNNHITRISSMVQSAAKHFSPPLLTYDPPPHDPDPSLEPLLHSLTSSFSSRSSPPQVPKPTTYHPFPPPSAFVHPSVVFTLKELGFGYRARFVQRTAEMLVREHADPEAFLIGLRKVETEEAREQLLRFVGVGRKVADCVLLMSMDKADVVPVDVHIQSIAQRLYNIQSGASKRKSSGDKVSMTPKLYTEIQTTLRSLWGDWAGWTQTVLFASDLPVLLHSFAGDSSKALKAVKIRSSTVHLTPAPAPTPAHLSDFQPLPGDFKPSKPPPAEVKSGAVVVVKQESDDSSNLAATLGFDSAKPGKASAGTGKGGTKLVVEDQQAFEGTRAEIGDSMGERIKRRRRGEVQS